MILEQLRKQSFWIIDSLKGGKIKRNYLEIKECLEHRDLNIRTNKINNKRDLLIKHATSTVPFYKDYTNNTIQNFPVVNKSIIRKNSDLFLSADFDESNRIAAVTSGSTGTPFKVFHDLNKKNRNSADTIYFANRAGFSVGEKLIYLKIWSENNKKSAVKAWLQNVKPVDVLHFNETAIKNFIQELESDHSTFGFLGYSSALELIARYLEKNNKTKINARVNSIISMSEALDESTKRTLSEVFDTQVVSRYSNIENGIIAQQELNGSTEYLINTASYYVEVLKIDRDESVEDNEPGRIVITDLYNYAMPMIRYDIGDIGSFRKGNKNYLAKIEGRKLDQIYATNGDLISSYIVYKNMWQYTDIVQYQLIQYGAKDYIFKINTENNFTKEDQLIKEFKAYLGTDANFKVEYVNEIPLLSSGKRKKIINTFIAAK